MITIIQTHIERCITTVSYTHLEANFNYNYGNVINQITVTGNNSDEITYSYTAVNDYPMSSLRVTNIGIKAADIEETAMGYNEKRCKDYAEYLLKKKLLPSISGTLLCSPLPHIDVNKIIRLPEKSTANYHTDYLIEEISIPLSPANYSLNICNIQEPVSYTHLDVYKRQVLRIM